MRHQWDLANEDWSLRGWRQNDWRWEHSLARFDGRIPDVPALPARVPGSVRGALAAAGVVTSPYDGLGSRDSEWIEHRHWTFTTAIPASAVDAVDRGLRLRLRAQSLDYGGSVLVDDAEIAPFLGSLSPVDVDLTDSVRDGGRSLSIVFTSLPADLGQITWTSRIREWKARFNYGWDWTPRIVQIGIAGTLRLEAVAGVEIECFDIVTDRDPGTGVGTLSYRVIAPQASSAHLTVDGPGLATSFDANADGAWHELALGPVQPWTVHPAQAQALYEVRLTAADGDDVDEQSRRVGFRSVRWLPTEGAPADAEPYLLELNGTPTFLAGVNWVPIRPDYADVSEADYLLRLNAYRDMGINTLRVWGGAARESDTFYRLTDELGFLVWQELPLSSSGLDNLPPSDDEFAAQFAAIAAAYAHALAWHPSLIQWGGGNELAASADPIPATLAQPALAAAARAVADADPSRRFVATSPLGPRAWAFEEEYGLGVHHDVHGPWAFEGTFEEWKRYWDGDDAILRSEVGVDGASDYALLERHGLVGPTSTAQQREALALRWAHSSAWWLKQFRAWDGTGTLEGWVEQSQRRQAEMLAYAAASAKSRFPRCAGFVVWLGHDTFPCPVSLALLDFDGTPKPVAKALSAVFGGFTTE